MRLIRILERKTSTVRRKRQQLSLIREETEDLLDYLAIVEARVKDAGKPRLTHAEVKNRYRLKNDPQSRASS